MIPRPNVLPCHSVFTTESSRSHHLPPSHYLPAFPPSPTIGPRTCHTIRTVVSSRRSLGDSPVHSPALHLLLIAPPLVLTSSSTLHVACAITCTLTAATSAPLCIPPSLSSHSSRKYTHHCFPFPVTVRQVVSGGLGTGLSRGN